MKHTILASFLVAALSASAAESSITYTYASGDFSLWGKSKSEIYDVAIHISDPALVGKKITAIRALVGTDTGLESTSLWLSKELTLEKNDDGVKVTVPDVYQADAALESNGDFGQLSVSLDTPYAITSDGIYVGYSLTVPTLPKGETLTNGQKNPVVLSPSSNPESFYIRASKDFLKWLPYNDKTGGAAAIYVTLEGEFAEYSVGIQNLAVAYGEVDKDFSVKATLSNIGASAVSQLGYTYSLNGQDFEKTLDLAAPIEPNFVSSSVVEFPIDAVSELGEYPLDLTVTTVNGGKNGSVAPSASTTVTILPFVPVHRPMLEEYTGTWCGWCTRGFYALETLNEIYGDGVVLAAYHNGDPMEVSGTPVKITGYPSATLDRGAVEDPYYASDYSSNAFGMKTKVQETIDHTVPAAIELSAVWDDASKTSISVNAVSTFLSSRENAGYKVGYLLISNGLSGKDGKWIQSNYYAGSKDYVGTDLEVLTTWPDKVPGLVFNDVVVDNSMMNGVAGSVPGDVSFNVPYADEVSFDIASNKIIQDKDKLYVAAFIINPDGTILNANKVKVTESESTAVDAVESAAIADVKYFDLSGRQVSNPSAGIFIKRVVYADGTVRTLKTLLK